MRSRLMWLFPFSMLFLLLPSGEKTEKHVTKPVENPPKEPAKVDQPVARKPKKPSKTKKKA